MGLKLVMVFVTHQRLNAAKYCHTIFISHFPTVLDDLKEYEKFPSQITFLQFDNLLLLVEQFSQDVGLCFDKGYGHKKIHTRFPVFSKTTLLPGCVWYTCLKQIDGCPYFLKICRAQALCTTPFSS